MEKISNNMTRAWTYIVGSMAADLEKERLRGEGLSPWLGFSLHPWRTCPLGLVVSQIVSRSTNLRLRVVSFCRETSLMKLRTFRVALKMPKRNTNPARRSVNLREN